MSCCSNFIATVTKSLSVMMPRSLPSVTTGKQTYLCLSIRKATLSRLVPSATVPKRLVCDKADRLACAIHDRDMANMFLRHKLDGILERGILQQCNQVRSHDFVNGNHWSPHMFSCLTGQSCQTA